MLVVVIMEELIIKTMELFKVPPRWLFLRIETENGIVGWGEPVIEGRADTVAAAVMELKSYIIGKNANNIEDIFQAHIVEDFTAEARF